MDSIPIGGGKEIVVRLADGENSAVCTAFHMIMGDGTRCYQIGITASPAHMAEALGYFDNALGAENHIRSIRIPVVGESGEMTVLHIWHSNCQCQKTASASSFLSPQLKAMVYRLYRLNRVQQDCVEQMLALGAGITEPLLAFIQIELCLDDTEMSACHQAHAHLAVLAVLIERRQSASDEQR